MALSSLSYGYSFNSRTWEQSYYEQRQAIYQDWAATAARVESYDGLATSNVSAYQWAYDYNARRYYDEQRVYQAQQQYYQAAAAQAAEIDRRHGNDPISNVLDGLKAAGEWIDGFFGVEGHPTSKFYTALPEGFTWPEYEPRFRTPAPMSSGGSLPPELARMPIQFRGGNIAVQAANDPAVANSIWKLLGRWGILFGIFVPKEVGKGTVDDFVKHYGWSQYRPPELAYYNTSIEHNIQQEQGIDKVKYMPEMTTLVHPSAVDPLPRKNYKKYVPRYQRRSSLFGQRKHVVRRMPVGIPYQTRPGEVIIPTPDDPEFKQLPRREPRKRPKAQTVPTVAEEPQFEEKPTEFPEEMPQISIEVGSGGVRIRNEKTRGPEENRPRKDKKHRAAAAYAAGLFVINQTWGNFDEIVDFVEALLNATGAKWSWDGSIGVSAWTLLKMIGNGDIEVNMTVFLWNLFLNELEDRAFGAIGKVSKRNARSTGRLVGFQMGKAI